MAKPVERQTTPSPGRVLIVDDHPVFRQGLAQLIQGEPDLQLCGSVGTAAEGLASIAKTDPDLVLVDLTLPDKSGMELIKAIRKTNKRVKLLVVSMHDETLFANRVLRLGGDGFIMKQEDPDEIIHAIRDVLNGHIYISEEILSGPAGGSERPARKKKDRPLDQLSDSELEILELLGQGKTNLETARKLETSAVKVSDACSEIKRKLKLRNQNELIRYAVCWAESGGQS
jgi:DNA-binding NarL/FixJ family response regulator